MLMQIGQKPEHDFSEPIGMLEDCHKRILHFIQTLITLEGSVGAEALNADDRNALERSLNYFEKSAPRHNADEEESLFPQLRSHSGAQGEPISERLASLASDHRWADAQHREVDTIGRRWLADGVLRSGDHARLRSLVHSLSRFYAHHIGIEEKEIFPAARRILSAEQRNTVGKEMAERRGLTWAPDRGTLP
jgi:hemerythrin-like domain-containing protein